ncbi:MAG: hypothetical protein WBL63_20670 [Candidatus Acidiferrum sp.]
MGSTFLKHSDFSLYLLVRRIIVLLLGVFIAFELSNKEVNPGLLLATAVVAALVVAIGFVPHSPRYVRKPKKEYRALGFHLRRKGVEPDRTKRAFSPPSLTQFKSKISSEPAWESSDEDESFETLRPFYLIYSKRHFTAIAVCLKFRGDQDYGGWQPVAPVTAQDSDARELDENHQWILIGYVPLGIPFDAKLKLQDSQSRLGVTVVHDLLALEDRPRQSVYLQTPQGDEPLVACASD